MDKRIFLSIVIPLYNEEKRLFNLMSIYQYLSKKGFSWEIILVNDGSTDTTIKMVRKIVRDNPKSTKLVSYSKNMGKGFAIRKGMLNCKGKYRLFTDIDLSTPIEEFNKFIPYLEKYDILIGSRKKIASKILIHQPIFREKLGILFTKLSQLTLQLSITDFTCGFKCFSKEACLKIFKKQRINRWGFDSEILFLAKRYGYTVKEIPVKWSNNSASKVKLPDDIIKSLYDLYRIRSYEIKQLYN